MLLLWMYGMRVGVYWTEWVGLGPALRFTPLPGGNVPATRGAIQIKIGLCNRENIFEFLIVVYFTAITMPPAPIRRCYGQSVRRRDGSQPNPSVQVVRASLGSFLSPPI